MDIKPSLRAEIVERRTYRRPKNQEGTILETEDEALDRVIGHQRWLWQRAKAGFLKDLFGEWQLAELSEEEENELSQLKILLKQKLVSLSGRTKWLGGTDISKNRESSQFNPGRRSTQFITEQGVKSFEDYEDGDSVTVLSHLGKWCKAKVIKAGIQDINKIIFKRGRSSQVEYFTPNHTWELKDGTRTDNLKVGDSIYQPPSSFYDWSYDNALPDEKLWWCYGLVYGDGSTIQNKWSRIRLCGKDKKYLDRFIEMGFDYSFPPTCNEDPIVYTGHYLKTLPNPESTEIRLLKAFIRGYLDADGAKNRNHRRGEDLYINIQATKAEAQDFIEKVFPIVGLYIINKYKVKHETNFGQRSNITFNYSIRANFGKSNNCGWYSVSSIEPEGQEEVWCLTVENDHSFILPNGIVTGNCSFLEVRTIHDVVDTFWLLLQGCGVGFKPVTGTLNGFSKVIEDVEIISSLDKVKGDCEDNIEIWCPHNKIWTIKIGDSAEAWAKSMGKLLAGKYPAKKIVLDFSEVRKEGERLKGYGWISSGYQPLANAYQKIIGILNNRVGELLTVIDILDLINHLGTVLSTRRSAQIALVDYNDPEWKDFATAKKEHWIDNPQRAQSNNSIVFHAKPDRKDLEHIFSLMVDAGGSEPGFINAEQAKDRAPWYKGLNPCAEILLGSNSFCNLVEINLSRFNELPTETLHRAAYLIARANYRQTLVNLDDGILQRAWHESNEFLHLCGVGVTGVVCWDKQLDDYSWQQLREAAINGCHSMADDLDLPRSKAVTTIKPSGTISKTMGLEGMEVPEGIHKPLGKFIFNNIAFSKHDPILDKLREANYRIFDHPYDPTGVLVTAPIEYSNVDFDIGVTTEVVTTSVSREEIIDEGFGGSRTLNLEKRFVSPIEVSEDDSHTGYLVKHHKEVEVNEETAIKQLERYKKVMNHYVDHNCSITVSYDEDEIPYIIDWLLKNWDHYVGVSFIYRNDPTKTAKDLGYEYLPQEVVDEETYRKYADSLLPIDFEGTDSEDQIDSGEECAGGSCPIR